MSITIPENKHDIVEQYDRKIYSWLLNKHNLTTNSEETQRIIDELPVSPLCGYFDCKPKDDLFNCLDVFRAYTSWLYYMKHFPVFNIFDNYVDYNNEEVEDYTNYVCELLQFDNRSAIIS